MRWSRDRWWDSLTPAQRREWRRDQRRMKAIDTITSPLRRIPFVGSLVASYWFHLLDEGVVQTLKPRWGALTFGFLNDGIKPTLWHTWQTIKDPQGPYSGIWVSGAPRNREDAERKLRESLEGR